jgi:integrase
MPLEHLSDEEADRLKALSRKAGRTRGQNGYLEEVGTKRKKWLGHYYVYVVENGIEHRRHRKITLGLKSDLSKKEARDKLRDFLKVTPTRIIADDLSPKPASQAELKPSPNYTLQEFWDQVYRPMKEPTWKESGRKEIIGNIRRYVLKRFGSTKLGDITTATLQMHINNLAANYSASVVEKGIIWSRAILEEAFEQEYIRKNPAKRIKKPETREIQRPVVDVRELRQAFSKLPSRERLMIRLTLILGLRPAECLALKRCDVNGNQLMIDESNRYGKLTRTKTKSSKAYVWIPDTVLADLRLWMDLLEDQREDALLFPNSERNPLRLDNYRKRHFRKSMEAAGVGHITMQMCRRSCSTYMLDGKHGNVKDIQGHLRHARPDITAEIYIQPVPESLRQAVQSLDKAIFG